MYFSLDTNERIPEMKKLEDKRTFEYVALFDSLLKGGRIVEKSDLLIAILLLITNSDYNESEGVYVIRDKKYKKRKYTREELIHEIKTDTEKGLKYKFNELNNKLDDIRRYISKQLKKYGIKISDVIKIYTDNSHAPSNRPTYYQYVDPEFDLMKIYAPALKEDADNSLMTQIDSAFGVGDGFKIDNIKKAFDFQKKYTKSLTDRIISAIKQLNSDSDGNVSLQSIQDHKFAATLEYALLLNDPIKIACLLKRFISFLDTQQTAGSVGASNSNIYDLLNKYIEVIEQQSAIAVKDLERISNGITMDELFGESAEVFDSVMYFLRKDNNPDLPDALFSYGKYCMAVHDYDTAEKCFKECLEYLDDNAPISIVDRIIIHNNLGNLYCDWFHIEDAENHMKESIKLIEDFKQLLPEEPNYMLSLSYNSLASVFIKDFRFDEAKQALIDAYDHMATEVSKETYTYNTKYEYQILALEYNIAFLNYEMGDEFALSMLELTMWKANLLAMHCPSADNLLLHAIISISYSNGLLKSGNYEYAQTLVEEALEIYDKLCSMSYNRFALDKTFGLQRLADVFEHNGQYDKAIQSLKNALEICESFNLKQNFEARKRRIEILNNLSGLLVEEKLFDEAIANCEEIIAEYRMLCAIDYAQFSFEIVKEMDNQAIAYYFKGDKTNATTKIQESLDLLETIKDDIDNDLYLKWKSKITNNGTQMY